MAKDLNKLFMEGLQRFDEEQKNLCFNPERPDLSATEAQQSVLQDSETQFMYVVGGNRCLAEGTYVSTTKGMQKIEDIRVGDYVYNEGGEKIKVLKTFDNGIKDVVRVVRSKDQKVLAVCTEDHRFLSESDKEIAVKDFEHNQELQYLLEESIQVQVENLGEKVRTYDLQVESPRSLYLLSCGLVTHNSGKCLISGTKVATPQGEVCIEDLEAGDIVFDEHGNKTTVVAKKYQGKQEVWPILENSRIVAYATPNHRWPTTCGKIVTTDQLKENKYSIKKSPDYDFSMCWTHNALPELKRVSDTWDIEVSNDSHLFCLANGLVTHNSQLGARVTAWWFNDNHPYMERPADWGKGPLTIMVIGRVGEQIESELFIKKLKPYLMEGSYKAVRIGQVLTRLEHKKTGNRILFFSHHNINEAREKVQAFTAQFIWLDEMADSASFIAELQMRLTTSRGRMLATFTPLIRSDEVRRMVDEAAEPVSKKVKLSMLDNPLIKNNPDRMKEVMQLFAGYSESERNTRLYGDWYSGDNAVYEFSREMHCANPIGHSGQWKHVASVDPAARGTTGLTIWAEDPKTGVWYCIAAHYLNILVPHELVEKIESLLAPYNIVRRIADVHEAWFFGTAGHYRLPYVAVVKRNRKSELIKNLQQALSDGAIKIGTHCKDLIQEFTSCQWADSEAVKIINSSKYHLLDTAQYFVDNKPKYIAPQAPKNLVDFEAELRRTARAKRQAKVKRGRKWK